MLPTTIWDMKMSALSKVVVALVTTFAFAGCGGDVDPTGVWMFTAKYGAGNCFPVGGMGGGSFTVLDGPNNTYDVRSAGSTVTAAIDCNSSGCAMTAMEVASTTVTINWSLTLTSDGKITGSGSMAGTSPNCSQAIIDVTGMLQ